MAPPFPVGPVRPAAAIGCPLDLASDPHTFLNRLDALSSRPYEKSLAQVRYIV